MVAILLFPFGAIASGFRRWPFNFNFCQFAGFLAMYWGQVSTCTLALTSINRYFCVVKSQKYSKFFTRKKTILSIVVVWISLLVQTLSLYAIPVIYRWDYDNLYCRATFRDEKIERLFFYFLWLPIHRSHGISNIGLWQSLLRCQTTQHHYFSFFTRIKRPTRNTHLCSGDKDISSTFCSFIWILCLLDSLHSHPNFTIWVSGMYPSLCKADISVVLCYLFVD